ncbi:hypothetical protein [Streptomyces misionensis]|uniref:hypothetical protein n=1 Tax=Streptomyces misionensis TaxID=67331 RepID=UPI0033AB55EC
MPRTAVEGIAPGTAVGDARSVDIDVQAPTADSCPQTWAVGARLTPVSGQTSGAVGFDTAPYDTWIPVTGAELTLPEAGLYELIADMQGGVITVGSVQNAIIDVRLFNVTAGGPVPGTERRVLLFSATADGVTHALHSNASASALYQVAGPTTVRAEASKHVDAGTTTGQAAWATNFRFKKISD